MPNYNQAHQFYAGVDLHARSMLMHVHHAGLDSCGAGLALAVTLRGSSPSFCVTASSVRRGF